MSVVLTRICLFLLRLNLWLWSRHLHKDLSSFARTEGAQQEQYQKLGVCLLLVSASSRGNCYVVRLSLQFYTSSHSAAVLLKWRSWLLREQLLMVSPLHRVSFTEAHPPGTFPVSKPLEKNLCHHWSPYRQQLVHSAQFIIRSKEWLISVPLVEVRRQMDERHLREPSICPFMAE